MRKGFTLIEVLVVAAIISILTSIIIPPIQHARNNAKACKENGGCPVLTQEQKDQKDCEWYKNTAQKDLPAKCLKYYR